MALKNGQPRLPDRSGLCSTAFVPIEIKAKTKPALLPQRNVAGTAVIDELFPLSDPLPPGDVGCS
jgi:hypothetical protein